MKKYTHQFSQYTESGDVESNCNAIIFYNKGDSFVLINNFPLEVGESLSIDTNVDGYDTTRYAAVFDPLSADPKLHVIRRVKAL